MPRIHPIDPDQADGKAVQLLDGVRKSLGTVPNIMATLAQAPAALEAYLATGRALGGGELSGALREQIALAVAGANSCDYCASAHTALGRGHGLDEDELLSNLGGASADPKVAAALVFAQRVVAERGFVTDEDVAAVRDAGYGDGAITEIIAVVAHNIFTNYFNHIAGTEIDFPLVSAGRPAATTA
jgi:uncharacterized peroxidase-related enzyme